METVHPGTESSADEPSVPGAQVYVAPSKSATGRGLFAARRYTPFFNFVIHSSVFSQAI